MSRDTTFIRLRQPYATDDLLTELAREAARRILATALVAKADAFVAPWKDVKLPDGRDRVVRHGHGPERAIQIGIGPFAARRAKVRVRGEVGGAEKMRFTSSIPPQWARRTKCLDALLRSCTCAAFRPAPSGRSCWLFLARTRRVAVSRTALASKRDPSPLRNVAQALQFVRRAGGAVSARPRPPREAQRA